MKLNSLLIAALCLIYPALAGATPVKTDAVKTTAVDITHSDENLFVKMDIDLTGYKGLNHNREVILTPVVAAQNDTLALPSIMVAGRSRYYHWLRESEGERPVEYLYRAGHAEMIPYQTSVKFEEWMNLSRVYIIAESRGCCDEPLEIAEVPVTDIELITPEPPEFRPTYAFMQPKEELVKRRELRGSAYIDFPVNRTELYPDYRRNPQELAKIRATIDSVRFDKDVTFKSMSIRGYASPEGSYSNNVRLAKGRTQTLKDYVLSQYDFPSEIIATSYDPEDWGGLRKYVEGSNIANREAILALIDSDMEPDPKNDALRARFPEQYAFLLREVYPGLRHSDYTVEYIVKNYTDINEIKHLIFTDPGKLSLREIFAGASAMEPGSPEYDEAFIVAARQYPDSDVANLNAANIMLSKKDFVRARAYLAKAGNSGEAVYARGVCEGLSGNIAEAENLLRQAQAMGVAQAAAAIEQLQNLK